MLRRSASARLGLPNATSWETVAATGAGKVCSTRRHVKSSQLEGPDHRSWRRSPQLQPRIRPMSPKPAERWGVPGNVHSSCSVSCCCLDLQNEGTAPSTTLAQKARSTSRAQVIRPSRSRRPCWRNLSIKAGPTFLGRHWLVSAHRCCSALRSATPVSSDPCLEATLIGATDQADLLKGRGFAMRGEAISSLVVKQPCSVPPFASPLRSAHVVTPQPLPQQSPRSAER